MKVWLGSTRKIMAKKTKKSELPKFDLRDFTFIEIIAEELKNGTWVVGRKKYKNYTDIPTEIEVGGVPFVRTDAEEVSSGSRNEIMLYFVPKD
jgi:hypothetical protein